MPQITPGCTGFGGTRRAAELRPSTWKKDNVQLPQDRCRPLYCGYERLGLRESVTCIFSHLEQTVDHIIEFCPLH